MPAPTARRRVGPPVLASVLLGAVVLACGQLGASPPPTPADFPGIAGFLARHGITVTEVVSGDAGCDDPELHRTAIRFNAAGLDQATPLALRVYIFRNREAYDRRRIAVDACARAWVARPEDAISMDAPPFVLIGQGPAGPSFNAALRGGLQEAAGIPGVAPTEVPG